MTINFLKDLNIKTQVTVSKNSQTVQKATTINGNPICADCGSEMILRTNKSNGNKFYGCSKFPKCKGTHSAHKDGRPMGYPADKKTKESRMKAHSVFDRLWKEGHMKRQDSYGWLANQMNISRHECHIGKFTAKQCEEVIRHCYNYRIRKHE